MPSGVPFNEVYDGKDDLTRFSILRRSQGSIAALRSFGGREVGQGTRFHYASSETVVLAVLLRAVTGTTLSEYLTERLWQPMGAEADATWVRSRDGLEIGSGISTPSCATTDVSACCWPMTAQSARGRWCRNSIYSKTDWHRQPDAFAPRRATPYFGYGYQFWTYPGEKRRFALLGVYGQSIFVDPELKLVMVITAVAKNARVGKESFAMERNAVWRGLIQIRQLVGDWRLAASSSSARRMIQYAAKSRLKCVDGDYWIPPSRATTVVVADLRLPLLGANRGILSHPTIPLPSLGAGAS